MEKIVERGLLYDFYGELLTEHQRSIYEASAFQDMSLSEIAQDFSISRQGVHDLIKRCDRALESYEQKLHLVERFTSVKERVTQISKLTEELENSKAGESKAQATEAPETEATGKIRRIRELSNEILEEL